MTIDEAINILKGDNDYNKSIGCDTSYEEQLAEWLEELKCYKNDNDFSGYADRIHKIAFNSGYNKALDDFVKEICKMIAQSENNGNYRFYAVEIKQAIAEIAEQLKAGGKE